MEGQGLRGIAESPEPIHVDGKVGTLIHDTPDRTEVIKARIVTEEAKRSIEAKAKAKASATETQIELRRLEMQKLEVELEIRRVELESLQRKLELESLERELKQLQKEAKASTHKPAKKAS